MKEWDVMQSVYLEFQPSVIKLQSSFEITLAVLKLLLIAIGGKVHFCFFDGLHNGYECISF